MAEWKKVQLSDVCEFIRNGYTYTATDFQNGVKISRIETISDRTVNLNNVGYAEKPVDKRFLLQRGDILFSHINSLAHIGKTAYFDLDEELYHGMNLLCIRNNNSIISKYLFYWLNSPEANNFYRSFAKKAINQCSISVKELERISFFLPPIEEQEKIAEILSTQDKLIELKQKFIDQKKQQKKWLMQNLLTGKIRLKGFSGEWEKVKLGDVCEIIGGGTPNTSNIDYWNGNIPWISSSDLKEDDIFNISIKKYITKEAVQKSSTNICPINSILLVSRVGVGKIAISNCEICTSQDFTNIIKCNCDKLYLTYVLYQKMQKEINNLQGTSIKGITSKEIKKFIIIFPPMEEQTAIAEILSAQDKEIELLEKQLEQEKQKKKALMQLLLTGKVRVI